MSTRTPGFPLAIAAIIIMMAAASAPSPFYPDLQRELGYPALVTTAVFAVYAVTLLVTLLIAGSISDHVGRRPVASIGFLLLAASIVLFWQADSIGTLIGARALQGVASGVLLPTLSALLTDLEPRSRRGSAAVWNTLAPMLGLASGAVAAGWALEATPYASTVVFGMLAVLTSMLGLAVWMLSETSPRHSGLVTSLRPRVAVPPSARRAFVEGTPAAFAGWATGGLFLSLGAVIVEQSLQVTSHLTEGLIVATLAGAGAIAAFTMRDASSTRLTLVGTGSLAVGTALAIGAIAIDSLPGTFVAVAIAGVGFGTASFGVIRTLTPLAAPDERGELFSAFFVVCYLAFGIPAVAAGLMIGIVGLPATALGYSVLIIIVAVVAAALRVFATRGEVRRAGGAALEQVASR